MNGKIALSLLSCALLTAFAQGDTLVPANTLNEITSPDGVDGDVTIENGGRLKLTFADGSVLSSNITNNGGVGDFSQGTVTLSGAICGTGEFYKAGAGTTILSAANTYTGVTYLDAGTLQAGAANAISQQSPVFLNSGATLDLNGFQQSVGSVSGSGSVVLGSTPLPAESGLVRLGSGKLGLGANSGFSGATANASISLGGTTITSGCTFIVNGGGSTNSSGGTLTATNTTGGTLIVNRATTVTGTTTLSMSGAGLTEGGSTNSSGGTLIVNGATTVTGNGNYHAIDVSGAGLTVGGSTNSSGGTLNTTTAVTGTTTLSVSGGGLTEGDFTNIYGGTLIVNGATTVTGTNTLSGLQTITSNIITVTGTAVLNTGALNSSGASLSNNGITQNAGTLELNGNNSGIGSGVISNSSPAVGVDSPPVTPPTPEVQSLSVEPQLFASMLGDPSLPVSSTNGTLITGSDNSNRTFSGVISGNGSVIKVGKGWWNLTGQNTYSGLTTVADGGLAVNGSIPGDVFVWGGVLGGSGQIGGSVLNQAIVSPGNSPGTLTIAGDYAQASTGFLVIQVASLTVYDKLLVGGQAHLDGGLLIQYLDGFKLKRGDSFNFLTAAGGIFGQFSQIVFSSDSLLGVGLEYTADGVMLAPVQYSFAKSLSGLTPNQTAVAGALDEVVNNRRVSGLVDELDSLSVASVPNALDKIAPTDLLSMFDASINSANVQADNLERRMEEIRGGSTGCSTSGLHLTDSHGTVGCGAVDSKQPIGKDGKELAPAPLSDRWGFFVNGSGEFVDEQSTALARGTDFTTGGISTGADYRLGDHAAAGVTAGYSNTSTNGRGEGFVKNDSGKLGLYGTIFDRGFFLNGALGCGVNSYDTKRETVGGDARGDADGTDFNALLGTGYTYRKGGLSTGPIASLRYSWVGLDGFTEKGSLAPLRFDDQSEDSLKSTVGMQTSYAFTAGKVTITPEVRAQWQHEYLDASRSIGASFLPGGSFSVYGPKIGQDSLLLDAGVTVQLTARVGVYSFYTGDLGRQNYSSHSVNGGVQMSF